MIEELKLTNKHKLYIARTFYYVFVLSIIILLALKFAGLNIYKPITASESINNFANKVESYWWANVLINSVLVFWCMYFITFSLAKKWGVKPKHFWKILILYFLAVGVSALRIFVQPSGVQDMSIVYDMLAYVITSVIFCKIFLGIKLKDMFDECASPYLQFMGLLSISLMLSGNILTEMIYSNFIAIFLIMLEAYIGMFCIYIIRNIKEKEKELNGTNIKSDK